MNIRSTQSPIKKALNGQKVEEKETDYYKETTRKRKVLLSGLIRKYKKMLFYDTRQLILYDNGTLDYFDPENGKLKVTRADSGQHQPRPRMLGCEERDSRLRIERAWKNICPQMRRV